MLGAVALRRERWSGRGVLAVATATVGTTSVLAGGVGSIDPLGVGLALGSAGAYAAYILTSAGQLERTDPFLLIALVTTGAAVTLTVGGAVQSDVSYGAGVPALALIAAVGLVATAGMGTFVARDQQAGPVAGKHRLRGPAGADAGARCARGMTSSSGVQVPCGG
jgi:drug/metabolite transporter (DMT)-like permease